MEKRSRSIHLVLPPHIFLLIIVLFCPNSLACFPDSFTLSDIKQHCHSCSPNYRHFFHSFFWCNSSNLFFFSPLYLNIFYPVIWDSPPHFPLYYCITNTLFSPTKFSPFSPHPSISPISNFLKPISLSFSQPFLSLFLFTNGSCFPS